MLYQNQIAEPVTCVSGAEPEMSSPGMPDLPVPLTNVKFEYTKVSTIYVCCFAPGFLKTTFIESIKGQFK